MTVNPVLEPDQHLLPKPENLFIALTGGNTFFKLDLKEAYQKVLFEEDSCKFLNINTHQGLYSLHKDTFWHFISTKHVSESNGEITARNKWCYTFR